MAQYGAGVRVVDHGEKPAKRVLTIEQALRWAYRDELPKLRPDGSVNLGQMASAWDSVTRYGEMMAIIDLNPYGVMHDPAAMGAPHPDALRIAAAVDDLVKMVLDIPEDWQPFSDLGDLGPLGEEARIRAIGKLSAARLEPRRLVVKNAVLREPPDWQIERPAVRYVTAPGGGHPKWFRKVFYSDPLTGHQCEQEVDGYDAKAKRPHANAYTKQILDPDPGEAAIWRAEWQVWVAALEVLAIDLEGALDSIDVRPSGRVLIPWEDERPPARVLPDMTRRQVRPMTLVDGRWEPVELAPTPKPSASAMARAFVRARDRQPAAHVDNPSAPPKHATGD